MQIRGQPHLPHSHRTGRPGRHVCNQVYNSSEAPNGLWRSLAGARKGTKARAHGSSADVVSQGSAAAATGGTAATASGAAPLFSYLGLGSRNTDTFLEPAVAGAAGGAAATRSAGGAAQALMWQLRLGLQRVGSSLAEIAYDGAAEAMPGWDASQMAGVLMAMALLRRRPEEAWLREFWSVSAAKMPECSAADLAMLSFALSELELRPPHGWAEALLAATLRLAEAPVEAADSAAAAAAASPVPAVATGGGGGMLSGSVFQSALQLLGRAAVRPSGSSPSPEAHGAGMHHVGPSDGLVAGSTNPAQRLPPQLWLPSHAIGAPGAATADSTAPPPAPVNSAYDMEDLYGPDAGPETSSGMAAGLLEPVAALWRGVRAASASVTSSWQRGRNASDLVTVLYNATSAGLAVEAEWLGRFLEAMRSRLAFLSGDDLGCLLTVAVEEGCGGGHGGCLLEPSREWQAALFARMDGINWSLQSRHLVECLRSITTLGLRPPRPWLRRQLLALQPCLPLLPNASLAQLATLLPALPLQPPPELAAVAAAAAATAVVTDADGAAAATEAAAESPASPRIAGAAGASAAAADGRCELRWFAAWLADLRAVAAERRDTMTPAELLNVVLGVSAVTASGPVASAPEAASALRLRSVALSYGEWRKAMVAAVAARIPESSLPGLCEAWQALAEAEAEVQLPAGAAAAAGAASSSSSSAAAAAAELSELRVLVADGLATHHAQQLTTPDVAPVLSSLAAAGLPLPPASLDALLACAQPLLPGLTSAELVTVALSLVRLSHKPNLAWQAAFCAACRRRLGLMTPQQRCSLLVASASLGLHLPDPWVRDFFAVSERSGGGGAGAGGDEAALSAPQLANLLWAVSCVAPDPPASWLERWEYASLPRLRELGPHLLAVVLKAMSTLHHRPSAAWQSAYFAALQRRLFAAGAAQLKWPEPEPEPHAPELAGPQLAGPQDGSPAAASSAASEAATPGPVPAASPLPAASQQLAAAAVVAATTTPAAASLSSRPASSGSASGAATGASSSPSAAGSGSNSSGGGGMLSATVTAEALNSVVYSLAALDLAPPPAWLDELMDAVRCKLSLLSTLDLSVVLAYLVARGHRPHDDWWESFLEALEGRFASLSAGELSSLLIMLHALKVSPSAHWLDAFCAATEPRLGLFQPPQLLQVLSCLHLFRHRPGQSWMGAYAGAVEAALPRFSPTELARVLMLLDHLNQRPGPAFMARFYDTSRPGLSQLETQELVNAAWAVVSCSVMQPDTRWVESLVEAARPRVSLLQQPQLRVLVAALGHMQRGAPSPAAADFLAFAREFLVL